MKASHLPRLCRLVVLAGLTFSATTAASAAEEYQLRFKFVPQQTLTYVSQNDATLTIQYNESVETPRHTEMMIRSMKVLSVGPDGVAELELSIDRAYMTATSDGNTAEYDSAHPEKAPEEFAEVQEATRKPTMVRVNALGNPLPREGEADPVTNDLLFLLPEQPVHVGDTWREKFETGVQIDAKTETLMRPLNMVRRFTLKSVENGIASIAMTTECLSPGIAPFQESQVMQRKPAGTLKFDIERGCLVDRDLRIDDKSVGFQGAGTAMTTRTIKIDRLIPADEAAKISLRRPLLSVQAAFGAAGTRR